MTIDWKKLNKLISQQVPDFVRDDGPNLVKFLKAYYEWMDLPTTGTTNAINNIREYRDIDRTLNSYVDWFHKEFMVRIPRDILVDKKLLLKHIKQFYHAKGTKQSYRFLFRILYNEEIDFYEPGRDLLRWSDGKWQRDTSLKVTSFVPQSDIFELKGKLITGSSSLARSRVEQIISYMDESTGILIYELFLSKTIGTWEQNETIVSQNSIDIGEIISNGLYKYPGKYINNDGHLSSTKKYQDSWYYQEYSYVIKSGIALTSYQKIIQDLLHPAGTKMFSEFKYVTELQLPIPIFSTASANIAGWLAISGTFRTANSELISDYSDRSISDFVSWRVSSFIDNSGLLGDTNATFSTDISSVPKNVIIKDGDNNYPSAYTSIGGADSSNTAVLITPYEYGSLANGNILIRTT